MRGGKVDDAALAAALARWATAPAASAAGERAAIDRIVAHGDDLASAPAHPLPARRRWWPLLTGVAVAASVALVVLVMPRPAGGPAPMAGGPVPVAGDAGPAAAEASFALLHSPMDEEILF